MNDNRIIRVGALYIRVSTHDQDELSPDAQIRLCQEYAKKNDIVIPKEFIFVESISGRSASNRKQFQRMISIAKSTEHPIDTIVVWKFSRFARNQEESIVYKSMLKKDNIDVLSVSEPTIDGPFGTLIERIIEWMDEYYSIRLSDEVLRGMKEKALRGGYQLSPPLGYQAVGSGKPFIINEDEFKLVDFMVDQYDNHNADFARIARNLNDMGHLSRRGNKFEARTIRRILMNPFYYGLVTWQEYSFMGTHEVRYTKEQFEQRIAKINSQYKPPKRRAVSVCKHWLSGLLKCGVCGATMTYNGSNRRSPGFQCYRYAKGLHDQSMSISESKIIPAICEYFEELLNGKDFDIDYHAPDVSEANDLTASIMEELKKLDAREKRIKLAYENEVDTLEEYKENKQRLQQMRNSLYEQLNSIDKEETDNKPSKEEFLERVRTVYDVIKDPDIDNETKGTFMRNIVKDIVFDKENNNLIFTLYTS